MLISQETTNQEDQSESKKRVSYSFTLDLIANKVVLKNALMDECKTASHDVTADPMGPPDATSVLLSSPLCTGLEAIM